MHVQFTVINLLKLVFGLRNVCTHKLTIFGYVFLLESENRSKDSVCQCVKFLYLYH